MKQFLAVAVLGLVVASGAFAQCPGHLVTSIPDRFTGVTVYKTGLRPAWGPATPNLYAFVAGQEIAFALIFSNLTEEWRYLRCPTTFLLADGKPVPGQVTKEIATGGAGIGAAAKAAQEKALADTLEAGKGHPKHFLPHVVLAETVTVQLNADAIAQLGAASKIEYKICNDEMVAPREFVVAAHEFACKVSTQGGGAGRIGLPPAAVPP